MMLLGTALVEVLLVRACSSTNVVLNVLLVASLS